MESGKGSEALVLLLITFGHQMAYSEYLLQMDCPQFVGGGNHHLRLTRVKRVGVKEKAGEGERRRRWFLERGDGVRLCDCVSQECVFLCHLALM